jgi:small ubiquitin-related modifier
MTQVLKALTKDYDALKLSPPLPVDTMWHLHVLDTRRYAQDCVRAFGGVIHHDPYGGLDAAKRSVRVEATKRALGSAFGFEFDKRVWVWDTPPPPAQANLDVRPIVVVPSSWGLSIKIRDNDSREETFFQVKSSTKLDRVFNAYAKRKGVAASSLRFFFNGQRLAGCQKPHDIGMEDDDQIDCFCAQEGC